jgi:hypothetical protein
MRCGVFAFHRFWLIANAGIGLSFLAATGLAVGLEFILGRTLRSGDDEPFPPLTQE